MTSVLQWGRLQVAQALLPLRLCATRSWSFHSPNTILHRGLRQNADRCRRSVSASDIAAPRSPSNSSANIVGDKPLHPRLSVLALFPPMTREIQDQQSTTGRQSVESKVRSGPVHHASMLERKLHPGEEKANRNIRFTEIQLCIRKQATKQVSNRYKNSFFALLKGPEIGEKRS